jgi:hypothetical protein
MASERSELEQRRDELTRSLPTLSEDRAITYRRHSDSSALDRAGVRSEPPEERAPLRQAEAAADIAFRDAQRELREIDAEIARMPRRPLGATFGRAFRRRGRT